MVSKTQVEGWACRKERTIRGPRRQQVSATSNEEEEDGGRRSPVASTSTATAVVENHHQQRSENDENQNTNTSPPHRFVCEICGKSFGVHQALGGHKTVHRVRPQPRRGGADGAGSSDHSCNRCGKIFKTGQQLGGHMRKHYLLNKKTQERDIVVDADQRRKMSDGGSGEGVPVVSEGGADVEKPATEEIDLELRLGF